MKKVILFIASILAFGCENSENLSKAALEIAKYSGSDDITTSVSTYSSTDKGTVDSYEVRIKNVSDVNDGSYPAEYLASIAAKTVYDNLNQEERNNRDNLNIIIETTNKKFEYNYSMKKLSKVEQYFSVTEDFFQKLKSGDFDGAQNYLNKNTINIDEFNKTVLEAANTNDAIFSKIEKLDLRGINFPNEQSNDVVELITFAIIGDSHLNVSTRFLESNPTKISGISIK